MTLITTRLNNDDYHYLQNNFEVIEANASLDDADVILLGENHNSQANRIKNCWLLNKITSDNDPVYLEGLYENLITDELFEEMYQNPIYNKIKFKKSDCQEAHKKRVLVEEELFLNILYLKSILKKMKINISDNEKNISIQKMNNLYSENELREAINQLLLRQFEIDPKYLQAPRFLNQMNKIAYLAKNSSGKELDALFHFAAATITVLLASWMKLQVSASGYIENTACLIKNIQQEEGKYYGIHNKSHLKAVDMLSKQINKKLMETLKDKKFIILFPNENQENITHVEQFFSSASKKTHNFAIEYLLILAIAIFIYHMPQEALYLLIPAVIVAGLLITKKIHTPERDFLSELRYDSTHQLAADLITLNKKFNRKYKEKLDSIPNNIKIELENKFLKINEEFRNLKEIEPINPRKKIKLENNPTYF